jgi:hypothetical protein
MDAVVCVALITGGFTFLGAAVGAAIGVLGPWLQTRTAARTERMKQIVQLAIEDHKSGLEQARHQQTLNGGKIYIAPLVPRLQYHAAVLDAIDRGKLDKAKLQQIRAESKELDELTRSEP